MAIPEAETRPFRRLWICTLAAWWSIAGGVGSWLPGFGPREAGAAQILSGQFIAKMYTEALGRIPDPSGWESSLGFFAGGCTTPLLRTYATNLLTSPEFLALRYDAASRVLVAYRSLYGRDPTAAEYSFSYGRLSGGFETWPQLVSRLLNASDFDWIALAACFNDGLSYFWGANPAIAITPVGTSGDFTGGTSSQLQALLNSTPAGGRVRLNQKAVVFCDTPITIPPGVRLETYAIRRPKDYASMARLVRVANFDAPLVKVRPGAQLVGVWVDGQVRAQMPNGVVIQPTLGDTRANIWVDGRQDPIGRTSKVLGCRSSNSAGGTHLALRGSSDSPAERCGINTAASLSAGLGAVVKQNLITGYANRHSGSQWSDGISAKCENAHIAANQIIDATDGGIILFSLNNGNVRPPAQRSKIIRNRILSSGNSAFYGIGLDPGAKSTLGPPPDSQLNSFEGAKVWNNILWSSPTAHFDVVLTVGVRILNGDFSNIGRGASVQNNTSYPFTAVTNNGLVVSGMRYTSVVGNTIASDLQQIDLCTVADVAASVSNGWASGTIQPYTDVPNGVSGCVGGPHAE